MFFTYHDNDTLKIHSTIIKILFNLNRKSILYAVQINRTGFDDVLEYCG